ncbi:hypothetical protein GW17_00037661 [Ensete ventricosum]|nr:hypothetical protein GW17_00037661 [Ensete ventricosum]
MQRKRSKERREREREASEGTWCFSSAHPSKGGWVSSPNAVTALTVSALPIRPRVAGWVSSPNAVTALTVSALPIRPRVGGCHPSPNAVTRSDRQRAEDGAILIGNQHHRSRSKTRAQSRAGAPGLQPFTSVNPGPHLLGTESAGRKCASNCPPGPDKPRQRSAGGIPREPGVSARGDPATVPRGPPACRRPVGPPPHHTSPAQIKWTTPISFLFFCFSGALPKRPARCGPSASSSRPVQEGRCRAGIGGALAF